MKVVLNYKDSSTTDVVVLDDGNRGNFNQAAGIAERLPGASLEVLKVPPLSFWRRGVLIIAARLSFLTPLFKLRFILKYFARLDRKPVFPRPAAVISAGARLAPINVILSRCLLAKSIQVLYPDFLRPGLFDLLVIPEHDLLRHPGIKSANNLLVIKGATNRVTPASPVSGRNVKKIIRGLPAVRKSLQAFLPFATEPPGSEVDDEETIGIAVLIGGNDRNYRISEKWASRFSLTLSDISQALGARVYLTTSRRTPKKVEEVFQKILGYDRRRFNLVLYRKTFANPVNEFLAKADLVLTTEDSINMVSEAASSGKPTVVLKVERKREKPLVFDAALNNLASEGYIRFWTLKEFTQSNVISVLQQPARKVLAETEKVSKSIFELLNSEKVLISTPSCLGDNLILSPAYHTIRENFPHASIDVLSDKRSAGYFDGNPYFPKTFYYDKRAPQEKRKKFLEKIRQESYRVVFDFRNSTFGIKSRAERRATFYILSAPGPRENEHETDRWLRLLSYYLPLPPDKSFSFPLTEEDSGWAESTLARLGLAEKSYVVLNPGGRWEKKRWAPEKFAELAGLIWRDYRLPSVVVGDKNETEIAAKVYSPSRAGEAREGGIINLSGQTTVRQLTALLSKAALLISNDTGTVHLASAVRCPVVVVFGPGDWRRYGPYQTPYRIVSSGLPCSPCLKVDCPIDFVCWERITPERVMEAISGLL